MHTLLKKLFKPLQIFKFVQEYSQDMYYYMKYNSSSPLVDKQRRLFYQIIIETHTVEKGLSLPAPRSLFGREKLKIIMRQLRRYASSYSLFPVQMACGAFTDYVQFHRDQGINDQCLAELEDAVSDSGGSIVGPRTERILGILEEAEESSETYRAAKLLLTRTSWRAFESTPLPAALVRDIVRIAQACPSQCNRQATKVHFFQDRAKIDALLRLQKGASGFSGDVGNLFVVTSDLSAWGGAKQRNQLYVDGALFAMSLLLACNAAGVASCPLNLAVSNTFERKIKQVGCIPSNERLIVMVAAGYPQGNGFRPARSPRRNLSEILRFAD